MNGCDGVPAQVDPRQGVAAIAQVEDPIGGGGAERHPLAGQRLWGLDAPALEADPVALTDPTVRTATPAS